MSQEIGFVDGEFETATHVVYLAQSQDDFENLTQGNAEIEGDYWETIRVWSADLQVWRKGKDALLFCAQKLRPSERVDHQTKAAEAARKLPDGTPWVVFFAKLSNPILLQFTGLDEIEKDSVVC